MAVLERGCQGRTWSGQDGGSEAAQGAKALGSQEGRENVHSIAVLCSKSTFTLASLQGASTWIRKLALEGLSSAGAQPAILAPSDPLLGIPVPHDCTWALPLPRTIILYL